MNTNPEKNLWQFFVGGDLNAFSALFKNYYQQLHNYGLRISNDPAMTEDCIQDFFVYLYDHRQSLGNIKCVKSYLFVSFRRALFKTLKKSRGFETIEANTSSFTFSEEDIRAEKELTKQRASILKAVLNELSPREREVIYLKYYSDLKTSEITEVMQISYQSVLNTLQKAFSKLRDSLENATIMEVLNK